MKSRIDYWTKENNEDKEITSTNCTKVPEVGEVIHFDTRSDRDWHITRFKTDRFYQEGVCGNFKVVSVKRYIRHFDTVHQETTKKGTYQLPSVKTQEIFEVFLEKVPPAPPVTRQTFSDNSRPTLTRVSKWNRVSFLPKDRYTYRNQKR